MEEEVAILQVRSGRYFALREVGARIWDLLQEPRPVSEILQAVLAEYDVEPARCEQDLRALLEGLRERGLVEVLKTDS
jgi:PqqD family protein of HPr-rel-A system